MMFIFGGGILRFSTLKHHSIDARSAAEWSKPEKIETLNWQRFKYNVQILKGLLLQFLCLKKGTGVTRLNNCNYFYEIGFSEFNTVELTSPKLVDIIVGGIGQGKGLTPTGDDIMSGLLAMLTGVKGIAANADRLRERIVTQGATRINYTTDVSRHYLSQAFEGEFSEPVMWLVYFLLTSSDKDEISTQFKKVFEIGATSGADIVSGILLGAVYLLNSR